MRAARYCTVDFRRRRIDQFWRRFIVTIKNVIDFADMYAVLIAQTVWERIRNLNDDHLGALDNGAVPQIAGAEIEIAVSSIGRVFRMAMSTGSMKRW